LIVLFVRSASTVVNVIIWLGFAISILWVVTTLLLYLVSMAMVPGDVTPANGTATGPAGSS
jgi:hypothetical protein